MSRATWRWLAGLLALFVAVLPLAPAQARSGIVVGTCFLRAAPGMTAAGLFASPQRFDCDRQQAGAGTGDYWVLSRPLPRVVPHAASVRTASVWQDRVTLYVRYADGAIRRTGFTSATTASRLVLGAIIDLPLPDHAAPPVRLLWHVEGAAGARGIVVGPRLIGHGERYRDDLVVSVLYAAFGGMVAALFVYNLALWGALRQPFQPAYCLMLLCLLGYAASSSGLLEQLTAIDNNDRLRVNTLTLAMAASSALLFARLFFEPEVFAGWLKPASSAVAAALFLTATGFCLLAPWHFQLLDHAISAAFIALMATIPAILVRAWHARSRYVGIFILAWGAPIILAGVRVLAAIGVIGWRFWIDNSTVPSMALEACLSALAIAGRIRLLSRERDEAREHEIAARLLADTDPLTGLLNRRSFLHQAIGREQEQALILVDIDHFKQVNDTIGHDGGDEVLRVVARMLRQGVPAGALVARLGGEEFAILTPLAMPVSAAAILDGLRAAAMPFDLTVTASIGACVGPLRREADWKELYRRADLALFEAKAAGRDRIRNAQPLACAA